MANTETMTITAALVELKTLSSRIARATSAEFVGVYSPRASAESKDAMATSFESSLNSVRDLINRRNAIKCAIITSNASTTVHNIEGYPAKADGTEYTVAEIIDLRKNGITLLTVLRDALLRKASAAKSAYEREANNVEATASSLMSSATGNVPSQKMTEEDKASALAIYDAYKEKNMPSLIDPNDIVTLIETLTKEIEAIESSTDIALSINNATTTITVTY